MVNSVQKTCLCCNSPLTPLQALTSSLCGKAACSWKDRTVPDEQRCVVCRRILAVSEYAQRTCVDETCRRVWLIDRPLEGKRKQQQLLLERATAWRDEHKASDIPDATSYRVTMVPFNGAVEYDFPGDRKQLFRDHLARVVREAFLLRAASNHADVVEPFDLWKSPASTTMYPDPPTPKLAAVLLQGCIACRGQCCRDGGDHAFITAYTILNYLETVGDSSVEEVVDAYLAHLAPRTMNPGCVYQHANGCLLPRVMRSITCNRYYCEPLRSFRYAEGEKHSPRAFFVASSDGTIESGVFATPTLVKIVRREMTA